jgi:hypothetical protein
MLSRAALLLVAALGAEASGPPMDCPRTLTVEQKAAVPVGWDAAEDGLPHRLTGVNFFDGPPAERASLVYDETAATAKEWTGIWRFEANPRGFWIACSYSGTSMVISRRLPAAVKVCRVTYEQERRDGPVGDLRKIECR